MKKTCIHLSIVAGLILPIVLAGCAAPPAQQNFAELSYRHLAPINLAVSTFTVETRYIPPLNLPHVEHRAPVPPYAAVRQWGLDRVRATGGDLRARLVILDASIVEAKLPLKAGITGAFTREQAARYDGKLTVLLEILDSAGQQRAFVTSRSNRSQTAPEGASIAARERIWFAMTEDMMRQLNTELEDNIAKYLGQYMTRH
ncbi:MAG: hypothetical protein ACI82H_000907 [Alphaproteobacteria bacterium]|jgi:hypothetical protein